MSDQTCLIRYGIMSHVGRFSTAPIRGTSLERGQRVVIQTDRGLEVGEVLIVLNGQPAPADDGPADRPPVSNRENSSPGDVISSPQVVRVAGPDDLASSRAAEELRPGRFALCQQILRDGNWPWDLIDVEPLLDGRATVLHYLGPHRLDVAPLRAQFRVECDFDVILQPIGDDPGGVAPDDDVHDHQTGGGCGSCDCSDGGGCGSASRAEPAGHHHQAEPITAGCAPEPHSSGCSSCGVSRLMAERKRARV